MDTARPFDLLNRILSQSTKEAFTPSPGVQEAVMSGGAPGGAQPGGPGGPPPGAGPAPGGDPASMGPPPGGDPGAPPPDAAPAPSPVEAKLDQLIQLMTQQQQQQQQQQSGGGAGGAGGGKSNLASVKFEPQHIQQMAHDISVIAAINRQMADQLGLEVPASSMFNVGMMGAPVPGAPAAGGPGQQQPAGPQAPGQPAGGAAPPSPIAQQLPGLPPVAGKSAAELPDPVAEAIRIGKILKAGTAVPSSESELPSRGYALASIVAAARSRQAQR